MKQICFVNCGPPGDQCACFREHMREVYAALLLGQAPPDYEIDRIIADRAEELYEP